jgi:hypothetical protein
MLHTIVARILSSAAVSTFLTLDDGYFPLCVDFLGTPLPLKRQKLLRGATGRDDGAAEMLERYELMSDELSSEFLQRQRLDYAFDMIRQMPIHSAMYTCGAQLDFRRRSIE